MAWGKSLEKLFEHSALAIADILSREQKIQDKVKKKFKVYYINKKQIWQTSELVILTVLILQCWD